MSAAATEIAIGFTRDPGLLSRHRLNDKVCCRDKLIEPTAGDGIATAVNGLGRPTGLRLHDAFDRSADVRAAPPVRQRKIGLRAHLDQT
jgi:hypothetical protein